MDKLFKNKKLIIILTAFIVILVIGAIFSYIAITKDLFNNKKALISQSEVNQVENNKETDNGNEIIDNNTEEVNNNTQEQIENQQENTENNNSQNSQPEAETTTQQNIQSMTQTKETKAVNQNTKAVETKTTTKSTKAQEETPKTTQSNSQTQTQTTPVTQETKQTETQVTQQNTPKQEEPKQIQCSGNNHLIETGNTGKWFNTKQEAVNYYNSTYANWSKKWENFEIDDDTFQKNCPNRYEIYQCICGKWTIDFFYEY